MVEQGHGHQDLLREMLREVERIVDHQVQALSELNAMSAQAATAAQAILAGGIVLVSIVASQFLDHVDIGFLALFTAGSIVNIHALMYLLAAYKGPGRYELVETGPEPLWVESKAGDARWGWNEHIRSVIGGLTESARRNLLLMKRKAAKRHGGIRLLGIALALYAASLMEVLWTALLL